MHMQLAILFLASMSMVLATGERGGCSLESCRQNLGVYYLPTETPGEYYMMTFHGDGTITVISSVANGDPSTQLPPSSNDNGVWTCDGPNKITVNTVRFLYSTGQTPGSVAKASSKLKFNVNGRFSGDASIILYDLKSTENQNQSQWIPVGGPYQHTVSGYKLFSACGH